MRTVEMEAIEREKVQYFVDRWEDMKVDLYSLYAMREDSVREQMVEAISLYYELLRHSHGLSQLNMNEISQLEALPLNGEERLQFIERSPGLYASFKQLDELFNETIKKLARLRVQK